LPAEIALHCNDLGEAEQEQRQIEHVEADVEGGAVAEAPTVTTRMD